MRFVIEQGALAPHSPTAARDLLKALGLTDWTEDHVVAEGQVYRQLRGGRSAPVAIQATNAADLAYNYQAGFNGNPELEVLHYTEGTNWIDTKYGAGTRQGSVCHLGMHCTEEELAEWKGFFAERGIFKAQEVETVSHTNPAIAGQRTYHYCVFDTKAILGVDLKFIVRREANE